MSKLTTHREQQHLTQEELAKKANISVRTIQRIEAGSNIKDSHIEYSEIYLFK